MDEHEQEPDEGSTQSDAATRTERVEQRTERVEETKQDQPPVGAGDVVGDDAGPGLQSAPGPESEE